MHGIHRQAGGPHYTRRLAALRQILLIRHGRSAHVHTGWIDRAAFFRWREAYEAAGIAEHETPPAALRELARAAGVVVASDAPRAITSAKAIHPAGPVVTSPLLRELEMLPPDFGALQLPLAGWGLAWLLAGAHATPEEVARARAAAAWIDELTKSHPTLPVVTHGSFRRLLANALLDAGWKASNDRRRIHHWSVYRLLRD